MRNKSGLLPLFVVGLLPAALLVADRQWLHSTLAAAPKKAEKKVERRAAVVEALTKNEATETKPAAESQAKPAPSAEGEKPSPAGVAFFESKIRPVLVAKCYSCHSADAKSIKGGLVLDTRAGIRAGGESGPAVVPGNAKDSLLLEAIRHEGLEMPPEEKLSASVVADFEKWVGMGAPDPREGAAGGPRKIDLVEGKKFWSFQPITAPTAPAVKNKTWSTDELDRFVLAALEAKNLQPSHDADPIAWLRRVSLDLIGLPPTSDEIDAFAADHSPEARARTVDRLLASPHFGERWGRHWLDVARYGESTGKERNVAYPTAWRYRDYVVDSFNADKPFDRFVLEQVAGDLLPAKTDAERATNLVATGFLALGPKGLNDKNAESYSLEVIDEQIDVVTRAFMGTTVACARCHDHKFDPIPQTDYYAMAGIFVSTDVFDGVQRGSRAYVANRFLSLPGVAASSKTAKAESDVKQSEQVDKKDRKKVQAEIAALEKRIEELKDRRAKASGKEKDGLKTQFQQLQKELSRVQGSVGKANNKKDKYAPDTDIDLSTRAMAVGEGKVADCAVRLRGEYSERGPVVPRGFLSVMQSESTPKIDPQHSGRLELAQWVIARDNPLTARVTANRVWFHLFGTGLVETIDNFGALGEKPSHPELLDHLARRLADGGWSVKQLIRSIVLSRTYGQSSDHNDAAFAVDPSDRLLWRVNRRRLDAEVIRDSALAASGRLDLARPNSNDGKVQNGEIGRNARGRSSDEPYRSVYLPSVRGLTNEMLALFDAADNSLVVGQREITTVATQALFLLNSPFILEQSDGVAERVTATVKDDAARVDLMYRLILARPAAEPERARAAEFVRNFSSEAKEPAAPWSALAQVLFSSAEFRYAY